LSHGGSGCSAQALIIAWLPITMRTPMFFDLCCFTAYFQLAFSCPVTNFLVNRNAQHNNFYVDKCAQAIRGLEGSEQWTVKFDFILGPGKSIELGINEGVPFPTPDDGFWLKSSHAVVTDKTDTEVFLWPPIHVHHIVCRTNMADEWYEQDVFEHQASFLDTAGATGMNKHRKRYDILNGTDGWARYYPAQTRVKCGVRLDDDRLAGKAVEYKLVINMDLVIDADKRYGFRPFSNVFWEGTRTGQIGYNLAPGTTALLSKEFQAPGTGSFDPHSLTSHTHPGAQSLKLMAKRLGGQSFAEPQCLFTLQYPVLTVEPGWQSQLLNVKPGPYVRQPTFNWSEIGLKWLSGNHSKSGIDGNRPCAFQKGDTFFGGGSCCSEFYNNHHDDVAWDGVLD